MAFVLEVSDKINSDGKEHILVPGLMSDMSIKGPVFWMRAGWWTETPVQKLWGFPVWLNSVSVTGIVALSSPTTNKINVAHKTYKFPLNSVHMVFNLMTILYSLYDKHAQLSHCFSFLSPICLMPSLSSISSCTLGISMCSRGPWGGPFTGVSKLRLFLLIKRNNISIYINLCLSENV